MKSKTVGVLLALGWLTSLQAHAKHGCDLLTSQSSLSRYEVEKKIQAAGKKFRLCVNSKLFSRYDLEVLAKKGAHLVLFGQSAGMSRWDIEVLSGAGKVTYRMKKDSFSRWDLEVLLDKKVNVRIYQRTSETPFSRWDFEVLLKKGAGVFLRVDNDKFSEYDRSILRKLGARIVTELVQRTSQVKLNRYELEALAKEQGSNVVLIVDDKRFSGYELGDMLQAGVSVIYQKDLGVLRRGSRR